MFQRVISLSIEKKMLNTIKLFKLSLISFFPYDYTLFAEEIILDNFFQKSTIQA